MKDYNVCRAMDVEQVQQFIRSHKARLKQEKEKLVDLEFHPRYIAVELL